LSQGIGPTPNGFFFFSSKNARWDKAPTPNPEKTRTEDRIRFPANKFPTTASPRVEDRIRESMVFVFIPYSRYLKIYMPFLYK
jgi:hypothetical protein